MREGDALGFCGTAPAYWWSVLDGDAEGEGETISHYNDVDGVDVKASYASYIMVPLFSIVVVCKMDQAHPARSIALCDLINVLIDACFPNNKSLSGSTHTNFAKSEAASAALMFPCSNACPCNIPSYPHRLAPFPLVSHSQTTLTDTKPSPNPPTAQFAGSRFVKDLT